MSMRLRRRDPAVSSTPGVSATQTARGSSIVRTMRTAWWPRFLVAGAVLTVIGVTFAGRRGAGGSGPRGER